MPSMEIENDTGPSLKKIKASHDHQTSTLRKGSRIFLPFRVIGHVTNEVPFVLQSRGQEYFLITCVGNAFQIYNCAKVQLRFVSSQTDDKIMALAAKADFTYAASGCDIVVFERAKEVTRLKGDSRVLDLLVFGDHLISITESNMLRLWNLTDATMFNELQLDDQFPISTILHPSTYLNKVLVGSSSGAMQLWNLKSQKLIFSFKPFPSPITCLVQSPVVDVVAIGCLDGSIYLYNIKQDSLIFKVQQNAKVTSISFRTDDSQHHFMASASIEGDVCLWDLDKRKIAHVMQDAHEASISKIQFLNNQPILVSSGADNAVKLWIFDSSDGIPRLWKSRTGHHAPPHLIRFYGSDGRWLLSASRDHSLRAVNITRDEQSTELSQGSFTKKARMLGRRLETMKLPQIVDFSYATIREKDWDNIITAHNSADVGAHTWNWQRKALGERIFKSRSTPSGSAQCVAVSACGNFGFVGWENRKIEMFNIQSGLYRKTFGGESGTHDDTITGLVCDSLNRFIVSAGLDGMVKIWDFATTKIIYGFQMDNPVQKIVLHGENDLMAVVLDNSVIRVVDIETRRIVREFQGHKGHTTDIAFSQDGRWLITSGLDRTIRTWDLPSGYMIDVFRTKSVVSSLAISPTGSYLATAHVDDNGIGLWANRCQFEAVPLRKVTEEDLDLDVAEMPSVSGMDETVETADIDNNEVDSETLGAYVTPDQLTEDMITLSRLPKSKWQTLLNLETIKQRNRPKDPPKQPERAPFFLPVITGVNPQLEKSNASKVNEISTTKDQMSAIGIETSTELIRMMQNGDSEQVFEYLKTLNPSMVDLEIRSLYMLPYVPDQAPEDAAEEVVKGLEPLRMFLRCITQRLKSKKDFELVQAFLNVLLRIHGDVLFSARDLVEEDMRKVLVEVEEARERIGQLVGYIMGVTNFTTWNYSMR